MRSNVIRWTLQMLTFIVLGIVPGTSIQLDFAQILLSGLLVITLIFSALYLHRKMVYRKIRQISLSLVSL